MNNLTIHSASGCLIHIRGTATFGVVCVCIALGIEF